MDTLKALLFLSSAAALLGFATQSYAASPGAGAEVTMQKAANEQYERDVDQVALYSQENAIAKLTILLKKYRGTSQEPVLLSKLADLQQQRSSIIFRISHGISHHSKKGLDLARYTRSMNETISTLNALIGKYPNFDEISHAYFMRGKSYEEIKNVERATKDFLHLVKEFPDSEDAIGAYMSLADFAIEAQDHPRAITYLKEVEKHPEDTHYPFALYRLAWSYYNLKNIPTTLSYAERHIAYYNAKKEKTEAQDLDTSDQALKENTLLDLTVFYFEGYEEKLAQYQLPEALPYFKKIESGPVLGRMIQRFAKLLRSHSHEADLIAWKDRVLLTESERPESLDVLLTVYEFQQNKRAFSQLVETAQDMIKLYGNHPKYESFGHAQKMLLETAEGLQQIIVKNKGASEVHGLSTTLASIYDSFTKMVDESDIRIPRVHYNLAETLFTIKDYPEATLNYRWVVDHGNWKNTKDIKDASLKAIAARYEVLLQKGMIPKDIVAKSLAKNSTAKADPLLGEWISWLDAHVKHNSEGTENFLFEANRALYAQDHIVEAVDRLHTFARKFPKSTYAIPAASLVLDTSIATADWEKTHELATDYMEVNDWKKSDFSKRLFAVAADSFYKQVEGKHRLKDYGGTLKLADRFIKNYGKSERLGDCLSLAGNAALLTGDKPRAQEYFSKVISDGKISENTGNALLARATLSEEKYNFQAAASDYRVYLGLPTALLKTNETQLDLLRRKTLMLTWLSGDMSDLHVLLETKSVCNEKLGEECDKFGALAALENGPGSMSEKTIDDAFEKARKTVGDTRTLFATIALEGAKGLAFRDRLLMVRFAAEGWSELDPIVKFTLIPYLTVSIPHVFELNRMQMGEVAPLRADAKYITHRVDMIHEMENAAAKVVKLPWSRIRAEVVSETAALYMDLSRGLSAIPAPKNLSTSDLTAYEDTIRKLTVPFEEKGQDMRGKAFEIASKFSIESESFAKISDPYFAENPSVAKSLKTKADQTIHPKELDLNLLVELDPIGSWKAIKSAKNTDYGDDSAKLLKVQWLRALNQKHWSQVAFFMQEAHNRALIQPGALGVVKAISLARVGARGEALNELDEARRDLLPETKNAATMVVVQYALQSYCKDRTQSLLKQIEPKGLNKEQTNQVAQATVWATVKR